MNNIYHAYIVYLQCIYVIYFAHIHGIYIASTCLLSVHCSGQPQQRRHRVWQGFKLCLATTGNDARHQQGGYCGQDIWVACWTANTAVPLVHRQQINDLTGRDIHIRYADKMVRRSRVFMDFLSMDGDEVSTATMCPTTQCPSCWCPREQLQDSDHVFPFRDTQEIRAELETERARLLNQDGTARDRCKDRVRFWWQILCLYFIYAWHILCIYYVYQRILNWISLYMSCISQVNFLDMHDIYHVYTMYIQEF